MVSSQNNTGFVQRKKNAGDKKKTSSYFHAVCRFATTMSAWISMLKLLTMINFVCVSGAAITMETGVSTQGAGTSEERHAHTPPVLEMRRDTHHPMKTGDQQDSYKLIYGTAHNTDDSYKLIYGHDGITHNKLTDDGVETSDHGSGDSVGFDNHAGGDRVESSDNTDGNNDEFDNYAGGESVESAGHVASDGVESAEEPEGPVVRVHGGMVRGLTLDKAHVFYGIPYAAPPVGQRRWAPPHPVLPWLQTYNATFPRPACMQACAGEFSQICPPKVSEDCLYLNVFVPRTVNLSLPTETQRPVLVWIHGGDFIAGSASRPLYDGRFMSNYSNTVVVNVEYRLGAFGFLVTGKDPELSAVGNYGMLDQQAALVWIKNNIPVFAGDPKRVTLVGESAGAQSVALHLMMRSSEFLFSQAAIQSLPFSIPLKTRWDAKRLGRDFARTANCSVSDLLCLKSLSARDVLRAQVKSGSKIVNPFRFLEVFETWGPYIDEVLIEDQPIAAFQKGYWQRDKPVIIGTTSEEGVIFVFGVFSKPVSVLESMAYATAIFKQHTLTVLHKYLPLYLYTDRRTMLSQIVTDVCVCVCACVYVYSEHVSFN
ncbi:crystal protein isoform X3 [Alosa sapidissima]|uniref:crystal protein isoform X3 n=1 Tax=Alosa sapidissima TaxID=34773 RepID=UPI001C082A57|nr:crystal protein isoform X3 [Alosa sapidissima]